MNNPNNVTTDLQKISETALKTFDGLTPEQINWRPSETGWSIGQCFEHLIKSNVLFFDELDKLGAGNRKNSLLESFSPLSGFFGNFLINSLKKDERKFKIPTNKIAPPSDVDSQIISIFSKHQTELVEKIRRTETADWKKTKVTSPFFALATYSLADAYTVIVEHERRHIRQAERVMQHEGFPK